MRYTISVFSVERKTERERDRVLKPSHSSKQRSIAIFHLMLSQSLQCHTTTRKRWQLSHAQEPARAICAILSFYIDSLSVWRIWRLPLATTSTIHIPYNQQATHMDDTNKTVSCCWFSLCIERNPHISTLPPRQQKHNAHKQHAPGIFTHCTGWSVLPQTKAHV